ncbi:hypothetical protein ACS0TY_024581 [Phlomoides rotata]
MATSGIDSKMLGGSSFGAAVGDQDLSGLGNQMAGDMLQAPYVDRNCFVANYFIW